MRGHYHCLRAGCYFVTNITTKLPWHIKKHEKAERRAANGFKYFTKREECGRLGTTGWGQGLALAAGLGPRPLGPWWPGPLHRLPPHTGSMLDEKCHRPCVPRLGKQSKPTSP